MFNYTQVDESKIEYVEIAPASELPNGERMFVEIEGKPIVIFNIAGRYFSIADVCSHDEGPVGEGDLEGYNITCPRHGAQFDVRTGESDADACGRGYSRLSGSGCGWNDTTWNSKRIN